jgi:hypothetical protein
MNAGFTSETKVALKIDCTLAYASVFECRLLLLLCHVSQIKISNYGAQSWQATLFGDKETLSCNADKSAITWMNNYTFVAAAANYSQYVYLRHNNAY